MFRRKPRSLGGGWGKHSDLRARGCRLAEHLGAKPELLQQRSVPLKAANVPEAVERHAAQIREKVLRAKRAEHEILILYKLGGLGVLLRLVLPHPKELGHDPGRARRRGRYEQVWSLAAPVRPLPKTFRTGDTHRVTLDMAPPSGGWTKPGRLRLLYECNPIGWIIEQAGGCASTGETRMLDVAPSALHQRIGFVFGSRCEVEMIEDYYATMPIDTDSDTPLFNARGLFRQSS